MYTITLEVNQICNLRCDYCYLGEKTNQKMTEETAHKGLEIAFLNVEKHRDRRLWVDFVGGEAFLSFQLLQNLVEYIEREAKKRNVTVSYSVTTNGTIIDKSILDWLAKYRFSSNCLSWRERRILLHNFYDLCEFTSCMSITSGHLDPITFFHKRMIRLVTIGYECPLISG